MEIIALSAHAGGKKIETNVDNHIVRTDLLESSGGEGSAPEPLDMLFVALASCSANYAVEFCKAREIDTAGLAVRVAAKKTEKSGLFDDVSVQLELPDDFPDKYRKAIVRATEKCSVKKHMQAQISVRTQAD